jgi:hypothetical protein
MTNDHLSAEMFIECVGLAPTCIASDRHTPKPLRFVWHHVLPQVCGGKTVPDNLVSLCDCCHYTIHAILWGLKQGNGTLPAQGKVSRRLLHTQRGALALRGYAAAVAAGTVANIPNEGIE